MAATWSSKALVSSPLLKVPRALLPASSPPAVRSCSWRPSQLAGGFRAAQPYFHHPPIHRRTPTKLFCEEFEEEEDDFNYNYKFPDPIPEFADAETEKFRSYLADKLSKKEKFKDSLDEIVEICTEIMGTFFHTEYGGPGTLLVDPFGDMADEIEERGLAGAPQVSRIALKWGQKHVDEDWKKWTNSS